MLVVCIYVHVKPDCLDAFIEASIENASSTIEEPGNLRFDVIQQADDPNRFLLYEVYRDEAGMKSHKETAHYEQWRDTVADMMAEPRHSVKHANVFPDDEGWG